MEQMKYQFDKISNSFPTMVSRNLTCDEIMPPLDDGESLVRIVRTVPSTIRLPRYQHQSSQEGFRNSISSNESGNGSSSKSSHFITFDERTVREVVTGQIKNSKLKNEQVTGLNRKNITGTPSVSSRVEGRPLVVNTYNHYGFYKITGSSSDRFNDDQKHINSLITPSNTTSKTTTNISSNSHNYLIKSPPVGNSNKTHGFSSSLDSKIIKVVDGSHLDNSVQQKYPQKVISSGNWALQQPTGSSIPYHSPQQSINDHGMQPKNISSLSSSVNSSFASHSYNSQQTLYSVVLQQPNQIDEETSTTRKPSKSPQKKLTITPHTSPRPGILVKNSWNNQTSSRTIGSPGTSSDDLFGITSLNKDISIIDNQIILNGSGIDELQRKRTRKQDFCDGESTIVNTSAPSDKFMMVEISGTRHRQPSSYVDISNSLLDSKKCIENNTTTLTSQTTDVSSFPSVFSPERIPKKRGRPKLSNASTEHQKQLQQKQQINLLNDNLISSPNNLYNSNNQHLQLPPSSPNSNVTVSVNFISPNSLFQQSSIKKPVETAAAFQTELKTKRKYQKKTPEFDPQTGEVMKKTRKKGPGRKSKREIELAAQQARESAILAEMGFPVSKSCGVFTSSAETIQSRQNFQQKNLGSPTASTNEITNNVIFENKIAVDEQMSINALCRFRTNSEHQQQKRRLTFSNFINSSSNETFPPFERPKFHSMSEKFRITHKDAVEHFQSSIASTSQQNYKQLTTSFSESDFNNLTNFFKYFEEEMDLFLLLNDDNDCLLDYKELLISLLNKKNEECILQKKLIQYKNTKNEQNKNESNDNNTINCNIFESQEEVKLAFDFLNLLPNACEYFNFIRIKMLGKYLYKQLSTEFNKNKILINKNKLPKLISLSSFNKKQTKNKNLLFEKKILEMLDFRSKGIDIFKLEKEEEFNYENSIIENVGINYLFDLLEKLFKKKDIYLDDEIIIEEENKIDNSLNELENRYNESLQYFIQNFNSLFVHSKTTSEHFVQNNENNNKKYSERRQSLAIKEENKSNNKTLKEPHKTNSLLFRPSNEFIEELFKDIIDIKLLQNCEEVEDQKEEDFTLNSSLPQDNLQLPTTSKKRYNQQQTNLTKIEENLNMATDINSPFMLMQNIDEQIDYTKNISIYSKEKLMNKYGKILERNKIINKSVKPIWSKQLNYCTSEQKNNFLEKQLQQTREICNTTINLLRDRSTLVDSCIDCINEFNQPQIVKEKNSTPEILNPTKKQQKKSSSSTSTCCTCLN
ncbi:hypothetical protein Mgra_00009184 [Meloidogyne graminicola]|uniref:Uncharacterized protein n=1 Tax=Meloidogyne graminicola TaxID=189291 RepID=A0A8S9ZDM1_9BILA|nr:hypothetical protein Mgra_00009184 [Meloidogyne graminicola]